MKEVDLSRKIVTALRDSGAWAQKIHGSAFQTTGLPDILGCYMGQFFGLEVKLPGKESTLTRIQGATLKSIRDAGGHADLVTSVEDAISILERIGIELGADYADN